MASMVKARGIPLSFIHIASSRANRLVAVAVVRAGQALSKNIASNAPPLALIGHRIGSPTRAGRLGDKRTRKKKDIGALKPLLRDGNQTRNLSNLTTSHFIPVLLYPLSGLSAAGLLKAAGVAMNPTLGHLQPPPGVGCLDTLRHERRLASPVFDI